MHFYLLNLNHPKNALLLLRPDIRLAEMFSRSRSLPLAEMNNTDIIERRKRIYFEIDIEHSHT